jgi:hypothetical protein
MVSSVTTHRTHLRTSKVHMEGHQRANIKATLTRMRLFHQELLVLKVPRKASVASARRSLEVLPVAC